MSNEPQYGGLWWTIIPYEYLGEAARIRMAQLVAKFAGIGGDRA